MFNVIVASRRGIVCFWGRYPVVRCANCGYLELNFPGRRECRNCNYDHGLWDAFSLPKNWLTLPC